MSDQETPARRPYALANTLWLGVLGGLLGFGAVYLMARPHDNVAVTVPGDGVAAAPAAKATTGNEMAAFVRKVTPEATWCAPCRLEMPALDRLQAAIGSDKFEVVALSLDKDGVEKARKFFADTKIANLNFYIDPTGKEGFNLKPVGLPTTLLIDAEGREIGRLAGPAEWDSEAAKALIAKALK